MELPSITNSYHQTGTSQHQLLILDNDTQLIIKNATQHDNKKTRHSITIKKHDTQHNGTWHSISVMLFATNNLIIMSVTMLNVVAPKNPPCRAGNTLA